MSVLLCYSIPETINRRFWIFLINENRKGEKNTVDYLVYIETKNQKKLSAYNQIPIQAICPEKRTRSFFFSDYFAQYFTKNLYKKALNDDAN